jgi:hypothetical protein
MAFITGPRHIADIDLYATSTTIPGGFSVGDYVVGSNGKGFRLALVGGSALVMGNLLQAAAQDTSYENMAVGTAGAAGDTTLQVTNGTATITNEQFLGGSLSIYTAGTIAIGDEYTILGVTGTLTTGGALTVYLDRPLRAAVTTSAKVNMKRNPWSGVIQAPASTQTSIPVGVALTAAASATYTWVQTHGPAAVLSDGSTFAVGSEVGTPSGTAGAVTVYAAGTTHARVGSALQAAASAHAISVFLQID